MPLTEGVLGPFSFITYNNRTDIAVEFSVQD